jgi:hypothetical protein
MTNQFVNNVKVDVLSVFRVMLDVKDVSQILIKLLIIHVNVWMVPIHQIGKHVPHVKLLFMVVYNVLLQLSVKYVII